MSYLIEVLEPLGKQVITSFTPAKPGIADGFVASADPYIGCIDLNFEGRPDFIPVYGGEVVRAFIQGDAGFVAVFFGSFTQADPGDPNEDIKPYAADARTLLLGSACPPLRYRLQDTAAIAYDVAVRSRHPALTVRPQDFVPSGTVLDEFNTFSTDGSLADILDALIAATESPDYGAGIDPNGRVFFKPNTSVLTLPYDAGSYTDLSSIATAITTAVLWTLADEPSISPWGGAYKPLPYSHTSISDAAAHERYGYVRPRALPAYALEEGYNTSYTSSNFTNAGGAVSGGTSPATRNSGTIGNYTLSNDDTAVMGVRVRYQTSEDAGTVRFRATCGVLYDVELPNTKGEIQTIDLILTPHEGAFTKWDTFRITANSGGTMSLHGFYPLRVNTDLLDATAPLVIPEQRPAQIPVQGIGILPAYLKLSGSPRGESELPCAGLKWTWNNAEGAATVYEIGASAYEVDEGKNIKVRGYYRSG